MFYAPTRAGNRGGQGLFKWEDVKDDKYRENYLGHSLNAPVGRWQKNKDLTWYAKEEGDVNPANSDEALAAELAEIKRNETEALAEALGYSSGAKRRDPNAVSRSEIKRLVKMDIEDDDVEREVPRPPEEEVLGLGFNSTKSKMAAAGVGFNGANEDDDSAAAYFSSARPGPAEATKATGTSESIPKKLSGAHSESTEYGTDKSAKKAHKEKEKKEKKREREKEKEDKKKEKELKKKEKKDKKEKAKVTKPRGTWVLRSPSPPRQRRRKVTNKDSPESYSPPWRAPPDSPSRSSRAPGGRGTWRLPAPLDRGRRRSRSPSPPTAGALDDKYSRSIKSIRGDRRSRSRSRSRDAGRRRSRSPESRKHK